MPCLRALGMVNILGSDCARISERLFSGDQGAFSKRDDLIPERSVYVGEVVEPLPKVPEGLRRYRSRVSALLLSCIEQVESELRNIIGACGASRVGAVIGSSTSGIEEGEKSVSSILRTGKKPQGYFYSQQEMGAVSEFVAKALNLGGPAYTVSTACSSSAKVFRSARALLDMNLCDAVIVGGADSLCMLTVNGFSALELIAPSLCNPFSKNRNGITIGEGAALFVMTRESGGIQLLGVGESSDAYHISAPDPEATGAMIAINDALRDSALSAGEIAYVNLHGTGTLHNDSMEAKAVASVFSSSTRCSSTKPLVGHMLGASGATELGFCWLSMRDPKGRLPPHCWDGQRDPELPPIRLVDIGEQQLSPQKAYLSNSFGFGGSNCAVVIGSGHDA